jgi:hypothetical protein
MIGFINNKTFIKFIMKVKYFYLFIVGILMIILSFNNVFAGALPPDDNIIMKLYQEENSHGALYNDLAYTYNIQYSDIFGIPYAGVNPHVCTGTNEVVKLSSISNAHVEIPYLSPPTYPISVCYGDLVCVKDTSPGDNCNNGGGIIVRLFQDTNSHISKAISNYPIKICCTSSAAPAIITDASFYDLKYIPDKISNVNINDRVKLMARGNNFEGKRFNFKLYNLGGTPIYHWDNVPDNNVTYRFNVDGTYYFTIEPVSAIGTIYNSQNTPAGNIHGKLIVTGPEVNSPPVAIIDEPVSGSVFNKGYSVPFEQSSYDIDDFFDYTWKFGDGNTKSGKSDTYVEYNTHYTYTSTGQKIINLSVKDERGLSDFDLSSVLIIDVLNEDGKYVFSEINQPSLNEEIFSPYLFEGRNSFAIEVIRTPSLIVKCLGGNCPDKYIDPSGNQQDILDPDLIKGSFSTLLYKWTFSDGTTYIVDGNYNLNKKFTDLGWKNAILNISLKADSTKSSVSSTIFKIVSLEGCSLTKDNWIEGGVTFPTKNKNNKCLGDDGSVSSDDCCPTKYNCVDDNPGNGVDEYYCKLDNTFWCENNNIHSCSDYTDETECNTRNCPLDGVSPNCGSRTNVDICGVITDIISDSHECKCRWDDRGTFAIPDDDICVQDSRVTFNLVIDGDYITQSLFCNTTTAILANCEDGLMTLKETSSINWDFADLSSLVNLGITDPQNYIETNCNVNDICVSQTRSVLCREDSFKLYFYNWINLIFAIILIFIIYFLYIYFHKKNIFKNKNNKKR